MGTKRKPNRDGGFCWFSCFQFCSGLEAVKAITALTQVITDLTMVTVRGHIMEEARSYSRLRIGRIMFVVPVTGRAACITFGGRDIGGIDTARESGYTAITSREDTNPSSCGGGAAASAGYQAVTRPPSKPRKVPTSVSRKSWRLR